MLTNRYSELIDQAFDFPAHGFETHDHTLFFQGIDLMKLIEKYGTPLKFTYLPKISDQIQKAKTLFRNSLAKHRYEGNYYYSYCTKSSHFSFVLKEALKNDIHIETSSAFDISLVEKLHQKGLLGKDRYVICNGFKRPLYIQNMARLIDAGFENLIPVLDNMDELTAIASATSNPVQLGLRIATEEEPNFSFYTSRLGIRYSDIVPFYQSHIKDNPQFSLKMLHFFINTGIKDTGYYWSELAKCVRVYCELKAICPTLNALDIGGGFPIRTSFSFEYDYQYMVDQILEQIKVLCDERGVPVPDIFTEFGSYTVGESGGTLFSVLDQKQQNDNELWYMMDGSFITSLPDIWGMDQRFVMFAVNHWDKAYQRVNLGGLTCDSMDYYNSEAHVNEVFLPKRNGNTDQPLCIGFFHTGAYQESLGGYGGIQHCLVPAPQHVIIDRDAEGRQQDWLFAEEQRADQMMDILGY